MWMLVVSPMCVSPFNPCFPCLIVIPLNLLLLRLSEPNLRYPPAHSTSCSRSFLTSNLALYRFYPHFSGNEGARPAPIPSHLDRVRELWRMVWLHNSRKRLLPYDQGKPHYSLLKGYVRKLAPFDCWIFDMNDYLSMAQRTFLFRPTVRI
jgi:hypothetical protein